MLKSHLLKEKLKYVKGAIIILQALLLTTANVQITYADSNIPSIKNNRVRNEGGYKIGNLINIRINNKNNYDSSVEEIERLYESTVVMYYEQGECLDISIEDFTDLYNSHCLYKLEEYVTEFESKSLAISTYSSGSSSGDSPYYYNTGKNGHSKSSYSKYDLLTQLKKGDHIYEANGGAGITGHSLIVEGKFYDAVNKKYYIRVIEAIDVGVVRSIFDDTRLDDKDAYIFRTYATTSQKQRAVDFAILQLGKDYYLDLKKDTSVYEEDWYCSELVWAAYKNQGVDLEKPTGTNEPGVTPRDISYSNACYSVSKYK